MTQFELNACCYLENVVFIIMWVGGWGAMEMAVDAISGGRKGLRLALYFILFLVGSLLLLLFASDMSGVTATTTSSSDSDCQCKNCQRRRHRK